ncbi:hypothetical protein NJC38_07555 [Pseudomonas sp. 21LCFQ010]|uniref:hypothetical protein n=1 Tax=Pseudomonas sp. 21LCFQ010 TaxID=2957506 RepID=UPI002096AA92|nr:hypothetical protein [Pseudomonas sp. 21LCFQ010]MCO8162012.1 hypothetical protein [Pseudomonas sp. 21LCFQ010]
MAAIAITLSSVTALSVFMAMKALISDPLLAVVFASAAVVLDLYKYLAWPIAMGLLAERKRTYAWLMIASAVILGIVSAWATYDRLLTSMMSGQARHLVSQQRVLDLQKQLAESSGQLRILDDEARSIGQQAHQLRERGMVTKAMELEEGGAARIAAKREGELKRHDRLSAETGHLQVQVIGTSQLPIFIIVLLCAGFAVALETVPALIGTAMRLSRDSVCQLPVKTAGAEKVTQATGCVIQETPATLLITGQQHELFGSGDTELMQNLLGITKATPSGTRITVREFAATLRVGNKRVIKLFQAAMDLGALRKTSSGYVTV